MMKKGKWLVLVVGILILTALDQLTKHLAVFYLKGQESVSIIKNVFELTYVENRGAAFGILQNHREFFLILTVAALIAMAWVYWKIPAKKKYVPLSVILLVLMAGAIGNMIDRGLQGYVVDFFYFKLIDFPVFNVADIYVTVSCCVAVILLLFAYKETDFEEIFSKE
ncbi:MAG: signal peptidase II [Lachnospiraceae bacterium]|nr:signal peptidase II [Lachnospiraceae bacterium]